ncbi:hypothetical protein MIND_00669200 [Mycena indigotica]|uniref:Uncharacterized protein n=1 Tax=Mycena indigotica TaxID=2126181 RepID=A0A8H6W452_9AGAR|nr:uncharacterized protein MIND_00669200 [Mycena indigotica]KAF7301053.1 hypothetical protein MIND_00669200 [Mycena indigotica]
MSPRTDEKRRGWSLCAVVAVFACVKRFPLDFTLPTLPAALESAFTITEAVLIEVGFRPLLLVVASHIGFMLFVKVGAHMWSRRHPARPEGTLIYLAVIVLPIAFNFIAPRLNKIPWLIYQLASAMGAFPTVNELREHLIRLDCYAADSWASEAYHQPMIMAPIILHSVTLFVSYGLVKLVLIGQCLRKQLLYCPLLFTLYCVCFTFIWAADFALLLGLLLWGALPRRRSIFLRAIISASARKQATKIWESIIGNLEAFQLTQRIEFDHLLSERRAAFIAGFKQSYLGWEELTVACRLLVVLPAAFFYIRFGVGQLTRS